MITLEDAATERVRPIDRPPRAIPVVTGLLNGSLFLTVLAGAFVFVEPSPYEAAAALLGLVCVLARVRIDRKLLPLIVLLVLWNVGGLVALAPVVHQDKTIQFAAISLFLAFTAIVYAALFAQDCLPRLAIVRSASVLAGTIAAVAGIIGYFELLPGAGKVFAELGRAQGTFKDPNVFGPFLVFPILLILYQLLNGRIGLLSLASFLIMLLGLFLSFSRGAWFHFALSAMTMVGLMLLTAPGLRARFRLVTMVGMAVAVCGALALFSLSFDAIGDMFEERAKLFQSYDAGTDKGRFNLQEIAATAILQNPFGLGPFEFARTYGTQQHNVYLQAFLVYGWLGGLSYIVLVALTLALGLRGALVATPWQPFMIVAVATFVGVAAEGAVIDTDHWRHFFLLLGMIWGLSVPPLRENI